MITSRFRIRADANQTDENGVKGLLESNDSPSDDQRKSIKATLEQLESDFQRATGLAFSNELQESDLQGKHAKGLYSAIRLRRPLLSCIRSVPEELWQRIFFLVMSDPKSSRLELVGLCGVARRWRLAAISHFVLWTVIPPITIAGATMAVPIIENTKNSLQLYLSRSGPLPLSFNIHISTRALERETLAKEILQMLTDQSYRWGTVSMRVPMHIPQMSAIKGKLGMLSKLHFSAVIPSSPHTDSPGGDQNLCDDYFLEAPLLCDVLLEDYGVGTAFFKLPLPWSQLETIELRSNFTTSYNNMLETPLDRLRTLKYSTAQPGIFHSTPITLRSLETFSLVTRLSGTMITSHLDLLTLPSLVDLEVRGHHDFQSPLYEAVLSLIRRSQCSLQRLTLDADNPRPDSVSRIVSFCPNLTLLDFCITDPDVFDKLILDPTSRAPVLPKLKVLTLRNFERGGVNRVFDAFSLMQVIRSRTETLHAAGGIGLEMFQPLEEVIFIWDNHHMLYMQLSLLEDSNMNGFEYGGDEEFAEVASKWRRSLKSLFFNYCHPWRDYINAKLQIKMDKLLREMEEIDLETRNTHVLMRRGIPYHLASIRDMRDGQIPGDRVFRFRIRAGQLCERWKPYLLRDVRVFSYLWTHYSHGTVSLKWIPQAENEKDGDLWKGITGIVADHLPSDEARKYSPW